MKAIVIYDTRFGSTGKVARVLEAGIERAGIETICSSTKKASEASLSGYDLTCIGGPTEAFTASKPMKEFLGRLSANDLSGKHGFAFDTRIRYRFSGSAARFIEKYLKGVGLQMIASRESAIVSMIRDRGEVVGAKLDEGAEGRFEQIGIIIGMALLSKKEAVVAL